MSSDKILIVRKGEKKQILHKIKSLCFIMCSSNSLDFGNYMNQSTRKPLNDPRNVVGNTLKGAVSYSKTESKTLLQSPQALR